MNDHYAELGVGKNASKDEIRKAYRKKAQKGHPDKGGDGKKFYAIQKAYEVLSDDARRSRYDLGGDDAQQQDINGLALGNLGALFMQIIDKGDIEHTNVVEEMRRVVKQQEASDKSKIQDGRRDITKREKAIKRIKHKGDGINILEQMLRADIEAKKRGIAMAEDKMKLYQEMLKILNDYEYRADVQTTAYNQFVAFGMGSPGFRHI